MRKSLLIFALGSLALLNVGVGCSGDDDDNGGSGATGGSGASGGTGGTGATGGTGGTGGSAGTGGSGGSTSDAGGDAAAAITACKAQAFGHKCAECACDHCITQITKCNAKPKCMAVLQCAAQKDCFGTPECTSACSTEVVAAGGDITDAVNTGTCQTDNCATECADHTYGKDGGGDAATDSSSDATTE